MKQPLLLAEGDAELCDLYGRFLTERGYEVGTASDGLDCLVKLRQMQPAVLVLDLELRWGGSEGVLARLREEDCMPWIPVVLLASAWFAQDVAQRIEPPVVACLSKPFALTALLEQVRCATAPGQKARRNARRAPASSELFLG